jgi:hypothetical protein
MSNSRNTVSTSRLGPSTKPFSPMHRFGLLEANFTSSGSETSTVKSYQIPTIPLGQHNLLLQRSPAMKENLDSQQLQIQVVFLQQENERSQNQVKDLGFELERTKRRLEQLQAENNSLQMHLQSIQNSRSNTTDSVYLNEVQ